MREEHLFFSKALILSDLFASGEYYNFYGQIKDTVLQSQIQKRLCTKRHVHSFKFTGAGFKVDIKGGRIKKRERERERGDEERERGERERGGERERERDVSMSLSSG